MSRRLLMVTVILCAAVIVAHFVNTVLSQRGDPADRAQAIPDSLPLPQEPTDYARLTETILAGGLFDPGQKRSAGETSLSDHASTNGPGDRQPGELPIEAGTKIKLIGTASGGKPSGHAVIEDLTTKKQALYHLHDSILNVGEIAEIRKDSILIRRGAQEELLALQTTKRWLDP